MDPDANLEEQLRIIALLNDEGAECADVDDLVLHGERLAELVQALHEWIAGGGFLPKAWRRRGVTTIPTKLLLPWQKERATE